MARANPSSTAGAPLPLSALLSSTIFHHASTTSYPFSTLSPPPNDDPAPPPFLSQSDHPTLGSPAWFLHPCETASLMQELLESRGTPGEEWRREWMESWLMLVGTVADLRE